MRHLSPQEAILSICVAFCAVSLCKYPGDLTGRTLRNALGERPPSKRNTIPEIGTRCHLVANLSVLGQGSASVCVTILSLLAGHVSFIGARKSWLSVKIGICLAAKGKQIRNHLNSSLTSSISSIRPVIRRRSSKGCAAAPGQPQETDAASSWAFDTARRPGWGLPHSVKTCTSMR